MDKQTKGLMLIGVIVIVALFTIITVDYNKKQQTGEWKAFYEASSGMKEEAAAHGEAVEKETPVAEKAEAEEPAAKEEAEPAEEPVVVATVEGGLPATFILKTAEYAEHDKGPVVFTHQKHNEEYKFGCGECHHDDSGQPLEGLKWGDEVEECIACHDKPGTKPKGKDAPQLSPAEELEYHAEALHENCIGCHKEYNKENNTKAAPQSCSKCHLKDAPAGIPVLADIELAPAGEPAKEEKAEAKKAEPEKVAEAPKAAEPAKEEKAAEPEKAVASAALADVFKMETEGYAEHKKGIVEFTHKKHMEDYKLGCGECHHDDSGQPIEGLKLGDPVQKCVDCHDKPGQKPRGKDVKLSRSEELEYHAEALHDNCIGCHKEYNRANNTKAAPQSCSTCHPKS